MTSYEDLRRRVLDNPVLASEGNHSMRVWRIAENIKANAHQHSSDDRLLHLMSRVGVFSRSLAKDLRNGHTLPQEAAILLEQLADLGDLSLEQWRRTQD